MTNRETLVIVEDEKRIADLLADYARTEGFEPVVFLRGEYVLPYIRQHRPALMLLDLMLPGMDGIEICKKVRQISSLPVIILTAKVDEEEVLLGLKSGADDYILKPFSPREVMARVNAVLRRSRGGRPGGVIRLGKFCLNEETRQLLIHDTALTLTPSEYGMMLLMMRHPKKVFSRKELMENARGYEYEGYHRTVDTHIKNLRKKIAGLSRGHDPVVSVYGFGYRFDPGSDKDGDLPQSS